MVKYVVTIILMVIGLMSGLLSLFRELMVMYRPDKVYPRSLFWHCVWIAFIISSVVLWILEHQARLAAVNEAQQAQQELADEKKRNAPGLSGFIDEIAMGHPPDGSKQTAIFLTVSVRNKPGALASVAEAWTVNVDVPGRGNFPSPIIHSEKSFELHRSDGGVIIYAPGDTIYDKTATPIDPGGMKRGTLASVLNGLSQEEVWQAGTIIRVTFEDGNGKVIHFERVMTAVKNAPMYFPGVQPRTSPPK